MVQGKTIIKLENFSQKDFQFRNGICSTGYKKYYTKDEEYKFFLCESRLSMKMQHLSDEYTDFETYHMLAYSIKNVIN